jgi:hypothetical protein
MTDILFPRLSTGCLVDVGNQRYRVSWWSNKMYEFHNVSEESTGDRWKTEAEVCELLKRNVIKIVKI